MGYRAYYESLERSAPNSDIPEADANFWRRAELQMPQPKKGIYIRLDTACSPG